MHNILKRRKVKVSLCKDAWSSPVFRGYMVVIDDWIDTDWALKSTILEFKRFKAPHTRDVACTFLWDVNKEWRFTKSLLAITTENASDVINLIGKLNDRI